MKRKGAAAIARHKVAQNCAILPWVSAKVDCKEPRFLQIGVTLFENPQFQKLTAAQKILYLCMCQDAAGHIEFEFPRSRFIHYGLNPSTARVGIDALVKAGFITREYSGRIAREANRFRFSADWKLKQSP